ncbi:hypothetical protein V8E36_007084 [Tilletia maclaganii]
MSIPTPSLSHLTTQDFRHVYEPAEDTFILLDALEQDQEALRGQTAFIRYADGKAVEKTPEDAFLLPLPKRPRLCVEIGSGSGCVSAFIAKIAGSSQTAILSLDVNPRAADATQRTGKANDVHLEVVQTSMLSSFHARPRTVRQSGAKADQVDSRPQDQHGLIDLLVFNPPYVPTTEEEEAEAQRAAGIEGSWAGGLSGTRLVDELIDGSVGADGHRTGGIETYLSPGGAFYLVAIRQNDPPALVNRLQARGLDAAIVLQRRAGREHLFNADVQRQNG